MTHLIGPVLVVISLIVGISLGWYVSGAFLHVCNDRAVELTCCAHKGKHSKCLPCRPTRDVS